LSFRTKGKAVLGNQLSTVSTENWLLKGFGMLIRGEKYGVQGGAVFAAGPEAIPAASLPTLPLGGLLLLIGP
jgi:hypothetical protein